MRPTQWRRSTHVVIGVAVLLVVVAHRYVLALGTLAYSLSGPVSMAYLRWWPRRNPVVPPPGGLPEAQPP